MEFLSYLCLALTFFSGSLADDSEALKLAAIVQPTAIVNPYVTQNVYGFADFTTTIGNTVMIFSPSSIAVPVMEDTTTTSAPPTSTIETKPIVEQKQEESIEIQPTKPTVEQTLEQNSPVVFSSIVEVVQEKATEPTPATKKPKKNKKNKAPTPSPTPLTVQAVHAITPEPPKVVLSSRVEIVDDKPNKFIVEAEKQIEPTVSSIVDVVESEEEPEVVLQDGNAINAEPEYDFLSRQPTEFVEETYRVVNLKPSGLKKPKAQSKTSVKNVDAIHPTGLVTKSGGTVIKDGLTTVHETSVIGTYISGKYAQVLQSTSQIFNAAQKPKIQPSSTLRILKTAAPSLNKTPKYSSIEEELPVEVVQSGPGLVRNTRRPAQSSNSFKNRFRNREDAVEEIVTPSPQAATYTTGKKPTTTRRNGATKNKAPRPQNRPQEVATVSAEPAGSYSSRRNKSTRNGFKPSTVQAQQVVATSDTARRAFKPKISPSNVQDNQDQQSTSLYKFKLNRTPGRWQYKTTPKPRVTIRKHAGSTNEIAKESLEQLAATPPTDGAIGNDIVQSRADLDVDLDGSGSVNGDVLDDEVTGAGDNKLERKLPIETIKVEISTPADFSDTYYEIATIKSPYTFQVGANKNTRYITVTSTFEKTLDPEPTSTSILTEPLTENILATTSHIDKEHNLLDSSIATLPVVSLGEDQPTPPLETLTETFSTTQVMLKTHILPVARAGNTTSYTLIQTYHVTRLVTATKTLPPMEAYHFVPSRTLNEFNTKLDEAGSELHLELEFGDENEHDEDDEPKEVVLPEDLNLANIGSDFDVSEVDKSKLPVQPKRQKPKPKPAEKPREENMLGLTAEQLALLRLLNPAAIPNVITTSKPVVSLETIYESHVLPIVNGASTVFSTISRPVATVTKTNYEIGTSIVHAPVTPPPINPLLIQQHQQQQQQQFQQQFQIQSTPVVQQQIVTQTDSKILKIHFGARTAYTTIFNTRVIPTMVTSYVTQSIAVQPSAYQGYFPAPYPPYPYVG